MPSIRGTDSKRKCRRHAAIRDLDQIHADLHSKKHLQQYKDTKEFDELPAGGAFYCIECSKWYESERNFVAHEKGSKHKRRVRDLKAEPYSQKEAEAAAGYTTDNGKTQQDEEMTVDAEAEVDGAEVDEVK
ncbi:hypothetical protein LTR08_004783 [Meristemomyces frigidus]|nr:hypothetical protein LTR08_004783 [Meristemomyces frigidus]